MASNKKQEAAAAARAKAKKAREERAAERAKQEEGPNAAAPSPETHRMATGKLRPGQEDETEMVTITAKRDTWHDGKHWPRGEDVEWPRALAAAFGYTDDIELPVSDPVREGLTPEEVEMEHEAAGITQDQVVAKREEQLEAERSSADLMSHRQGTP